MWRGSAESPGENVCPKGEISISYMNKRVDGFIFSHLKTVYCLCKIELSYMGKLPILHGQRWEKRTSFNLSKPFCVLPLPVLRRFSHCYPLHVCFSFTFSSNFHVLVMRVRVCTRVSVRARVCVCERVYMYVYVSMCVCMCGCVRWTSFILKNNLFLWDKLMYRYIYMSILFLGIVLYTCTCIMSE